DRRFGELTLRTDVDPYSGQTSGQPGVLTLTADGETQLVVGHGHVGLGAVPGHDDLVDLRRRQRLGDEVAEVLAEGHAVALLAPQLVHDHANPATASPHAGADGVDVGVVRPDSDLRAVARLAGARLQLDDAVGDLGHLELEQPLDQARMGAADDDLGPLG